MATKKKSKAAKEETPVETSKKKVTKETSDNPSKAAYLAAKADSGAAWKEVQGFMKTHKLKPGTKVEDIKDKKVAKEYKELKKAHKELKAVTEAAEAEMKKNRPASAPRGRYADLYTGNETPAEKKKLRAQWRAQAKKDAKGEASSEEKTSKKKSKTKEEAPAVEKTSSKKEKKADKSSKKKVKKSKVEDED